MAGTSPHVRSRFNAGDHQDSQLSRGLPRGPD